MEHSHPDITPLVENWRDTMVKASAHGLPGALGALCDVLNISQDKAKDKEGKSLIRLFCKPRSKNSKLRRATNKTNPEDWRRFVAYAGSGKTDQRQRFTSSAHFPNGYIAIKV